MDILAVLSTIFLNQRHDLTFIFKFRKISKFCKTFSAQWLDEFLDDRYLINVNITEFKNLRKLKATWKVTDYDLQQLKYLTVLIIAENNNITNAGLKHLSLTELDIRNNRNINDDGIKHMKLRTLYTENNLITDSVIKDMPLEELGASNTHLITNNGIKHLKLKVLYAVDNREITDEGIKDMNLEKLNVSRKLGHLTSSYQPRITDKGIRIQRS